MNGCCLYCYSSVFSLIVSRSFELKSCAFMTIVSFGLCESNGGLRPNSITLASSELAPNMFGASSELAPNQLA